MPKEPATPIVVVRLIMWHTQMMSMNPLSLGAKVISLLNEVLARGHLHVVFPLLIILNNLYYYHLR